MKKMNIDTIFGICLADNVASRIVLERTGFIKLFEGVKNYQGENRKICRYIYRMA